MPTAEQAFACVRVCQMLSNGYQPIHVFRYNPNTKTVFILAGVTEVWKFWFFQMVAGGLMMTKPDFSRMTRQELRAYILAHRDDDDAIEALIKRGDPNSPTYPFPQTDEDLREMEEILKRRLDSSGGAV